VTNVVLVLAPQVKIDGVEIPGADYDSIIDLRVERSVSMPSQLSLRMNDPGFTLVDGTRYGIGKAVVVAFPNSLGTMITVFDGEIVSVGIDQDIERPDTNEVTVLALDKAHRLASQTRVRTFQNQTYADVVRTIASEQGLQAEVGELTVRFDYLIQTSTNFSFLNEIAFRCGYQWRVVGTKLIFKPRAATSGIVVTYGEDMRRFKARFTAQNEATDVSVRSWDPLTKKVITGTATVSNLRSQTEQDPPTLATGGRTDGRATAGAFNASSLVATSSDEATELAKSLGSRIASSDFTARGVCIGRPEIDAGSTIAVVGVGTKLSGSYYVTNVEHRFGRGDMTTTFSTGDGRTSGIVDLLGGSPERVSPFGQNGLTIGIVTNNKDPDGIGRVRVKFPALSDQEESWWARVVTPGGGSQSGLMLMPQIDDEVLVGFEHGDLRRPYVLGGLWGPKAKPPTAAETFLSQNKVIQWGLRTAAGATLAFRGGDQPADKHFKVALADGTMQYLGSDKIEIIAQNKSIELKSGQASILITDQGDIQLTGMNIKLNAKQGVTIDGLTIAAKAKTSCNVEGSASLALKGGGTADLQASGITSVKGSLVKIQ
jgi:uncharacterized protein involved in type VI secretion and phage assembly